MPHGCCHRSTLTQVPDLQDTVDQGLSLDRCDSDTIEDGVQVVRSDTVTRPLGEECDGDDDSETSQVSSVGEETLPAGSLDGFAFEVDGRLDLVELEIDQWVRRVTTAAGGGDERSEGGDDLWASSCNSLIFGENLPGFVEATLANQPTWTLGNHHDENDLDYGGCSLPDMMAARISKRYIFKTIGKI